LGAFPALFFKAPETGLSAPIPPPSEEGLRYFRFNPLRVRKPALFPQNPPLFFCNVKLLMRQQEPLTEFLIKSYN
jgi:hypothetical protein